jgi:hypothetical protein
MPVDSQTPSAVERRHQRAIEEHELWHECVIA